jgi:hypothetical protein
MLVELFPVWAGGKAGYLGNVTLDGDLIVERSRDPECDLARVLRSRGITGNVTVFDGNTGRPRTQINVEKLAQLRTRDDQRQLGFEKYREPTVYAHSAAKDDLVLLTMPVEANEAA